jgi:hypothetical protein
MHPDRDLPQRTLSEARHDRSHHSKKTERHSALSVHAWVSQCSSFATKPTTAPIISRSGQVRIGTIYPTRSTAPINASGA